MICPDCGSEETSVPRTKQTSDGRTVRIRECLSCGLIAETIEELTRVRYSAKRGNPVKWIPVTEYIAIIQRGA